MNPNKKVGEGPITNIVLSFSSASLPIHHRYAWLMLFAFEEQVEGSCACLCHVGDETQKCSPRTIMVVFAFFWPWLLAIFELTFFYQLLNFISAAAALPYFFCFSSVLVRNDPDMLNNPSTLFKKNCCACVSGRGPIVVNKVGTPQNGLTWEMWHARVCQTTMEHCFFAVPCATQVPSQSATFAGLPFSRKGRESWPPRLWSSRLATLVGLWSTLRRDWHIGTWNLALVLGNIWVIFAV